MSRKRLAVAFGLSIVAVVCSTWVAPLGLGEMAVAIVIGTICGMVEVLGRFARTNLTMVVAHGFATLLAIVGGLVSQASFISERSIGSRFYLAQYLLVVIAAGLGVQAVIGRIKATKSRGPGS
jgi:hypothetical protein